MPSSSGSESTNSELPASYPASSVTLRRSGDWRVREAHTVRRARTVGASARLRLTDILGWEHFYAIADAVNRHLYRADGDALAAGGSIPRHSQRVIA